MPLARSLAEMTLAAQRDAAALTGVAAPDITVLAAERVMWPDGGLGCPRDGMLHTQVLVPGYRIRLEAGDHKLLYHSGRHGEPLRCPPERARPALPDTSS